MDVLTKEQRRLCMSRIRGRDTSPERFVRRLVHAMGLRFRLHRRELPGTPDLVFAGRRKIIFVHGCFWHMHSCRYGRVSPKTNSAFWQSKREGNVVRDKRNCRLLRQLGWEVLVIWECQIRDEGALSRKLTQFLGRTP